MELSAWFVFLKGTASQLGWTMPLLVAYVTCKLQRREGRHQYLSEPMKGMREGKAVSSGELQLAVKEAMNVELPGDMIRFALRRDSPFPVLRDLKLAKGVVRRTADGLAMGQIRLTTDGLTLKPTRSQNFAKMTFFYMGLSIIPFLLLAVLGPKFNVLSKEAAKWYLMVELGAVPMFWSLALSADAARRLVNVDEYYPLPLASSDAAQPPCRTNEPVARSNQPSSAKSVTRSCRAYRCNSRKGIALDW